MASLNVRVNPQTHRTVRELAHRDGKPMQDILERAVEEYRRKRFLEEANARFAALKSQPAEWCEELAERALWDNTLDDNREEA